MKKEGNREINQDIRYEYRNGWIDKD